MQSNQFRPRLEVLEGRDAPSGLSYRQQCVVYSGLLGGALGAVAGAGAVPATLGTTMYYGAWIGGGIGTWLGATLCPRY